MSELGPAVSTVVDRCLAIQQGEDVLTGTSLDIDGRPVLDGGRFVFDTDTL